MKNIKLIAVSTIILLGILVAYLLYDAMHPRLTSDNESKTYKIIFKCKNKNIDKIDHVILLPTKIRKIRSQDDFERVQSEFKKYDFDSMEWATVENNTYEFKLPVREYSFRLLPFKVNENYYASFMVSFEDDNKVYGYCHVRTQDGKYVYMVDDMMMVNIPSSE